MLPAHFQPVVAVSFLLTKERQLRLRRQTTPTTPEPQAPKTLTVNSQQGSTSLGFTVPDNPFGKGFSAARNGIDTNGFGTLPATTQTSGQVTLNGFVQISRVDELESSQRLQGASNLTFDFAAENNPITGSITDVGVYSFNDTSGSANCSSSTCVYTKVRDVSGTVDITGRESNSSINLTLGGSLTDGAVVRTFNGVQISATLLTNPDKNRLRVSVSKATNLSVTGGNSNSDNVTISGEWLQPAQ